MLVNGGLWKKKKNYYCLLMKHLEYFNVVVKAFIVTFAMT